MSIRSFVFCDICNVGGTRVVEARRGSGVAGRSVGRRISDGRSWFEGALADALAAGWHVDEKGRHVCARCFGQGLHRLESPASASPNGATR
jgi:hypothetical protein